MTLAAYIHLAWSHREDVVAAATVALVLYRAVPADMRSRVERRWPRWGALVGLVSAIFPVAVDALAQGRAVVTGREPRATPPAPPPTTPEAP